MQFVHIADTHLDSPFTNLADKDGLGNILRLEQRKVLKKIIEYIKINKIKYFFISGDLYEQNYIKKSSIEYINNLFKEIPDVKIFISPGNHDPYTKDSYYNKFNWNENVKIFNSKIEKVELEEADIYGYGFDDFYCTDSKINELEIQNKNKLNILIIHGTLDGASIEEKQYNSISKKVLQEKGFDYIALGHIHKTNYKEEKNIVYPGSTTSLGFDELGKHGMIVGNLEKQNLELKFIPLDEIEFKVIDLDCTNLNSIEDLVEKLNEINFKDNELYKINLVGKRNFEINTYNLYKLNLNEKIIKIKNNTKINYNLEEIKNENTLRGIFVENMLEKLKKTENKEEIKIIENAIEIGLDVLE